MWVLFCVLLFSFNVVCQLGWDERFIAMFLSQCAAFETNRRKELVWPASPPPQTSLSPLFSPSLFSLCLSWSFHAYPSPSFLQGCWFSVIFRFFHYFWPDPFSIFSYFICLFLNFLSLFVFIFCETARTRRFSVIFAKLQWRPCFFVC